MTTRTACSLLLLACASASLIGCAAGSGIEPMDQDSVVPGWHEGTLAHGGLERQFRFYAPKRIAEGSHAVVLLHGGRQSMDKVFASNAGGTQEWTAVADDAGFLLLVPNGTDPQTGGPGGDDQHWNDCRPPSADPITQSTADDVGFVVALADWAAQRFPVDAQRFFVTGASNGGKMTFRIATERPERVAGAAVFIANLPDATECAVPSTPVPMLIVNGTADAISPFEEGDVGGRGSHLSALATRDVWRQVNRPASPPDTIRLPDLDPDDGSTIACEHFSATPQGAALRFCVVDGGGHAMPSRAHRLPGWLERIVGPQNHDAEGARLAWAFLSGD